jgi:hypothetical protein
LAACDILVLQDVHNWNRSPIRRHEPTGIEIIRFPGLRFASPSPFDTCTGSHDREAVAREAPDSFFMFHDALLARLRKRIPDKEARFDSYRTLQIDGVLNYVRLAELEQWRLLEMDRKFGSDIGRFILEQHKHKQLFYAPGHPAAPILSKLLAYLLERLRIADPVPEVRAFESFNTHEVPVHPKIADVLGISWASPDRLYRHGNERLTWESYTRRYIETYG